MRTSSLPCRSGLEFNIRWILLVSADGIITKETMRIISLQNMLHRYHNDYLLDNQR